MPNRKSSRKNARKRGEAGRTAQGRGVVGRAVHPSTRPPQQARSRATRERVIRAAIACFEQRGFEETTTAMIADRAGVAVGSVYNYFVDKRALLLALLDETSHELADPVVAGLDPTSWRGRRDPRELTRSLIDAVFRAQSLKPGIQRILWARYFKDPDFEAPFEAVRARLRTAIEGFLAAVDEQGLVRAELDRKVAPVVILNAVQWNAIQAYLQDDPRALERTARGTADLVARYVFADADGSVRGGKAKRRRPMPRVRTSRSR